MKVPCVICSGVTQTTGAAGESLLVGLDILLVRISQRHSTITMA